MYASIHKNLELIINSVSYSQGLRSIQEICLHIGVEDSDIQEGWFFGVLNVLLRLECMFWFVASVSNILADYTPKLSFVSLMFSP